MKYAVMNNKPHKYAVIRLGGKQYKVSETEEILVDKILNPKDLNVEVLLVVDREKGTPDTKNFGVGVKIGKPKVAGAKVKIKIISEEKGEKLLVTKYKAKSRYRRRMGFRPQYTRLLIEKIMV